MSLSHKIIFHGAVFLIAIGLGAGWQPIGAQVPQTENELIRQWNKDLKLRPLPGAESGDKMNGVLKSPDRLNIKVNVPGSYWEKKDLIYDDLRDPRNRAIRDDFARKRREMEGKVRKRGQEKTFAVPEPVLAYGKSVVAIVGERYLTKDELDFREQLLTERLPSIKVRLQSDRAELLEKQHVKLVSEILNDWIMNTTLAMEAIVEGKEASEQEIDQYLKRILSTDGAASEWPGGESKEIQATSEIRMVPEKQLRDEARDAILVEKFINTMVDVTYDESDYRRAYNLEPTYWLDPPSVRVFHIFMAFGDRIGGDRGKARLKEIKKLRSKLKKKKPDYAELAALSDNARELRISDMGWLTPESIISSQMRNHLLGLRLAETSDVFTDLNGYHVVRIMERKEGTEFSYAAARPRIEAFLFNRMKEATYDLIRGRYEIRMNSGGINRWEPVSREEYIAYSAEKYKRAVKAASTPRPVEGSVRRSNLLDSSPGQARPLETQSGSTQDSNRKNKPKSVPLDLLSTVKTKDL